jgi:uncharacterized membrane protein YkgB
MAAQSGLPEFANWIAVAIVIVVIVVLPKLMNPRRRLLWGAALCVIGIGALGTLVVLDDPNWVNSDHLTFALVAAASGVLVFGLLFLVSGIFGWYRVNRPRRRTREKWPVR